MDIAGYRLFLDDLIVDAEIGIHDFERGRRQRLRIEVEMDLEPARLPSTDNIADALDYDWLRDGIKSLVSTRKFDLQETVARAIVQMVADRAEVQRVAVRTSKPDVYPDARAVGCRLEARRSFQRHIVAVK